MSMTLVPPIFIVALAMLLPVAAVSGWFLGRRNS